MVPALRVSGTIAIYLDSAHVASKQPIGYYQIAPVAISAISINLEAALEAAGMAQEADLAGGTQS